MQKLKFQIVGKFWETTSDKTNLKPIKIIDTKIPDQTKCLIIGWGKMDENISNVSNTLKYNFVQIFNRHICRERYRRAWQIITEKMLCAMASGTDTCQVNLTYQQLTQNFKFCTHKLVLFFIKIGISKYIFQGDSGTPLICNVNGSYYVTGITSWGIDCASTYYPGVYTDVFTFRSWIVLNNGSKNTYSFFKVFLFLVIEYIIAQ